MSARIFADHAQAYRLKSHPVIPFKPGEKRPSITGWAEFSEHMPNDQHYDKWLNGKQSFTTGRIRAANAQRRHSCLGLSVFEGSLDSVVAISLSGGKTISVANCNTVFKSIREYSR